MVMSIAIGWRSHPGYFRSKVQVTKTRPTENIGYRCMCDASMPAAVENVQWCLRAVYLDAVTIGMQGRH